ncbi:MAG: sigma-70 family RNA polymerase sigma factor [Proteobacteria bacterium]|nr:sigma-70 family RNA polymerase sigma factor [Pseudomonadota bacterium]
MAQHDGNRTSVSAYMNDIHRSDLLTREEENALARRWVETRDEAAAEELVQRNLRFVVKVAMGYRKYGVPLPDLIQEGNLGLIRAVEKFDPSRGTRLISYAVWWIKAYIQSHVIQTWSLVRIGTTQAQRRLFYKLPKALAVGGPDGEGSESRIARIAEELDARPKDVVLMMGALRGRDLSLDVPLDEEGGGTTFGDRVECSKADPEAAAAEFEDEAVRKQLLTQAISRLPEREREIIRLRHQGPDSMTLREVGRELGLSRERVRQLEAQAIRKLKNIMVPKYERSRVA